MRGHFFGILCLGGFAVAQHAPRQAGGAGPLSLASTNPTAIPLSSIYGSMPVQSTEPLPTTYPPSATPPVSGAPRTPTAPINPSNYPTQDRVPPIDSPEVQEWIRQVQNSGVPIPGIPPKSSAICSDAANAAAAANASASGTCWWTCGGCTRDTDITTCPDQRTWGVSFDDGPSPYTPALLRYLDEQRLKATFFVVGSRVISRPEILRTAYLSGNQLSVHTWSHTALTTLSTEQIIAELGWTMKAIKDVVGVTPNTMRPPYGDLDDRVRAICRAMGLTPIIWTTTDGVSFDTEDWRVVAGQPADAALRAFERILNRANSMSTGFIVLSHDLYQQSVDLATGYILPDALARGFQLRDINTCLKRSPSDAYIETSGGGNAPNPNSSGGSTPRSGATPTSTAPTGSGTRTSTSTNSRASATASSGTTPARNSALSIFPEVRLIMLVAGLFTFFL